MTDEQKNDRAVAIRENGDPSPEGPQPMALTIPARTLPTTAELQVMGQISKTLANVRGHSVPKDIDSPSKAAAVILAGWELGVKPMTAFRHIFVVNGRTEPDSQIMMGLVKAKDPSAEFIFHGYTAERCEVELRRNGKSIVRVTYTLEDAQKSGQLAKGGPWKQYPRDMCAWAAVKRACRLGAPDLINAIPAVDVGDAGDLLIAGEEAPLGVAEEVERIEEAEEIQTEMIVDEETEEMQQTSKEHDPYAQAEEEDPEQMPLETG